MLVLAGGRSSRMGRDKASLMVGERSALVRVVEAGLEGGAALVVVVGTPGQSLPELPSGAERCDDPADRLHEGPLSGLATGLGLLHERGITVACLAPCDALWLDAEHVRFMLRTLRHDREFAAVVPETGPLADGTRVLHPLCGAVRVEVAWQTARALLQRGQRAARALLLGLNARRLAVATLPEPRVVEGCNTPEQWERAVAELSQRTDPPPAVE